MYGRFGELLLILIIVFILFGAGKLPKVMNQLGKGLRVFRKSIEGKTENNDLNHRNIQYRRNNNRTKHSIYNRKNRVLKANKKYYKYPKV